MTRFGRFLAALGLVFGSLGATDAAPIIVTGGTANLSQLGLETNYNSVFDKIDVFAFGPTTFDIPHGTPTTVTLSDFDFTVGINATVPQAGYNYTLTVPFTVNGVSGTLSQPFTLDISYSDTLTLKTGGPTTFHLPGGSTAAFTLLGQGSVTVGPQSGVYRGQLTAQVVVTPEPATLAVFGGIAMVGAVGYRRRKAHATA